MNNFDHDVEKLPIKKKGKRGKKKKLLLQTAFFEWKY